MTIYEMTKNAPGFNAYCRRRCDDKVPTMAEYFEGCRNAEKAKFRAFCKRRGLSSILKAEKPLLAGQYNIGNGEIAQLKRVNGEFISVFEPSPDMEREKKRLHCVCSYWSVCYQCQECKKAA